MEEQVRWSGGIGASPGEGARSEERQAQAHVRGDGAGQRGTEGPDRKKTVGPAHKREALFNSRPGQHPLDAVRAKKFFCT